jgi:hypothetical protein
MSRETFGPLGALLGDLDLARVLAALGAFYPLRDTGVALAARVADPASGFASRTTAEHGTVLEIPVRLQALEAYVRDMRTQPSALAKPSAWEGPLAQWNQVVPTGARVRFRVVPGGAAEDAAGAIDPGWLARLLSAPGLGTCGAYIAWPSAPLELTWEWPLRIGIPRVPWSEPFRDALDRGRYRELYELRDVDVRGGRCDVLLLPASLHDAMRAALDLVASRASAVVVIGGTDQAARQTRAWLDALRHQFRAGAVALAHVPAVERACWFTALLGNISHNATFDMALMLAARAQERAHWRDAADGEAFASDLTPPLLFADRAFIDRAVMDELARRVGRTTAALARPDALVGFDRSFNGLSLPSDGVPVAAIGEELARVADRVAWHHETGDARVLVDFRRRVEQATGTALELPAIVVGDVANAEGPLEAPPADRAGGGIRVLPPIRLRPPVEAAPPAPARTPAGAVPPAPAPGEPPRRRMRGGERAKPLEARPPQSAPRSVLFEVLEQADDGTWVPNDAAIAPNAPFAVDLAVGVPRDPAKAADRPIDLTSLPPSSTGHVLGIAVTPLWRGADGAFAPAQTKHVHLPATGDSGYARFYFLAPPAGEPLRARVLVLFGCRVLQTLLLEPAAVASGKTLRPPLRLRVENRVSSDFGERTQAPPFDAALVVNDNLQGTPGITGIATDGVAFVEPEGLDKLIELMRTELNVLNLGEDDPDAMIVGLDDDRVHRLLRGLAARGAMLTRMLKADPRFAALTGAYRLQVIDARPGAYLPVEFFYDGKAPLPSAERCEHAVAALGDVRVHAECPHRNDASRYCPAAFWGFSRCIERQPVGGLGQAVFRQPQPGASTMRPLRKALLAASRRVRSADLDPPDGIETLLAHAAGSVVRASSWQDWQQKVTREAPSLLVLLPHSLDSPDFPGVPALEICGMNLASANLEREYVCADPEGAPVVLLLGCSTALPRVPFLNFVGALKDNGAALVIGTIATIRGRQTAAFVRSLLEALHEASTAGGRTFDEVFLDVKRRLLAGGDPFVLSLLAYGDTGWHVEA